MTDSGSPKPGSSLQQSQPSGSPPEPWGQAAPTDLEASTDASRSSKASDAARAGRAGDNRSRFQRILSGIWRGLRAVSLWVGMIVLGVSSLVTIAVIAYQPQQAVIEDKTVLWLNLNQPLLQKPSFDLLGKPEGILVTDILLALEYAKEDPRVVGLVADLGDAYVSMAQAQEIGSAVKALSEAGKETIVFSEDLGSLWNGSSEYLLAAQFDTFWLQTTGGVGLNGFAIETPYIRDALEEIGVVPEVAQRHEYKSAADTFSKNAMSDPVAQNYRELLRDWTDQLQVGVSSRVSTRVNFVSEVLDAGPYLAEEAAQHGFVDHVGYEEEFFDFIDELFGDSFPSLPVTQYLRSFESEIQDQMDGPTVALIYGVGEITGADDRQGFDAYGVLSAFEQALESDEIAAVVFRVDSPGGAYPQSDMIWYAMRKLREANKPVIVSIADTAASGGYYVSMAADEIFAPPGAIVGSIGVFGGKPVLGELWRKLGVNWDRVAIGENATISSTVTPYSASERARFTAWIDAIYDDFTDKVVLSRDLPDGVIDTIARGRIFSGEAGLQRGLIDQNGGFIDALERARTLANLDNVQHSPRVTLPPQPAPWERAEEVLESYGLRVSMGIPFGLFDGSSETLFERARDDTDLQDLEQKTVSTLGKALASVLGVDETLLLGTPGVLTMPPLRLVR